MQRRTDKGKSMMVAFLWYAKCTCRSEGMDDIKPIANILYNIRGTGLIAEAVLLCNAV